MMNNAPLDSDSQSRFRSLAGNIDFSALDIPDQLLGKSLLAGMLVDANALANAPAIIDAIPGLSSPLKRVFEVAFDSARNPPRMANGAVLPSTRTVMIAAAIGGALVGIGVAVLVLK